MTWNVLKFEIRILSLPALLNTCRGIFGSIYYGFVQQKIISLEQNYLTG